MKKIIMLSLTVVIGACGFAQRLVPKTQGSSVAFAIKNFGLTVNGSFTGLQGAFFFNPANPGVASFNVTVDAGTINTGNNSRDSHLKKGDYFNSTAFPKISIASSKVSGTGKAGSYLFEGIVTIKGKAETISFPFTAVAAGDGYLFEGSFKLNRRDFKVGGNSLVLSDLLTVNLKIKTAKG